MNDKILNIYRSILSFAGMHVAEDGSIYFQLSETTPQKPVLIGKEPLVFPERQQFDQPDQNRIYFHPFGENFLRGESEVVTTSREAIAIRLNYVTAVVAQYLIDLLSSPQQHKTMNEEQTELLKKISEADDKSSQHWGKLMTQLIKSQGESAFVKLYLKRSGTYKGKDCARLGVVTFPFYQDMLADKYESLRVKDKVVFRKIMEFMFPGLDKPESYNHGTLTQVAPYLDALMMSSAKIAQRLNELLDVYGKFIPNAETLRFDMDWSDHFQDLDQLRSDIRNMPDLKGNAGVTSVQERQHPHQDVRSAPIPTTPVPEATPGASIQTTRAAPAAQPTPTPTPAPAEPAIRENERGAISFADISRGNPVMAGVYNPMSQTVYAGYGGYPYGARPLTASGRTSDPTWASPQGQQYVQNQPMVYGAAQPAVYAQQALQPGQPIPSHMLPPGLPPLNPGFAYAYDQMGQMIVIQVQNMPMAYAAAPVVQPAQVHPGGWYRR